MYSLTLIASSPGPVIIIAENLGGPGDEAKAALKRWE